MLRHLLLLCCLCVPLSARAQAGDPVALIELHFAAAPRAQIAIWIEDDEGHYLSTVRLTEATGYRGVGNRPGASEMNSGYRWPYGRREGVLPHWAMQRGAAMQAQPFMRVIFQARVEGYASRTTADNSTDEYYCLTFNQADSGRDALDAVTCASPNKFSSDKGRYLTEDDVAAGYAEPYESLGADHAGSMVPLPLHSGYPPRMDLHPCVDLDRDSRDDDTGVSCYDHRDALGYADHVHEVMPNIDAVTMATPEGGVPQSELFSVPGSWPRGDYVAVFEVNVEGDYSAAHGPEAYPAPTTPAEGWDAWATLKDYGYPYRGQPSVVYRVPFTLGEAGTEARFTADAPVGATSWDHWGEDYGELRGLDGIRDDHAGAPGSGADRLMAQADGVRAALDVQVLGELPGAEEVPPPAEMPPDQAEGGEAQMAAATDEGWQSERDTTSDGGAVILSEGDDAGGSAVGPVLGLAVATHPDRYHAHEWVRMRFRTPHSALPLHRYEVRVSTHAIEGGASFLRQGRPARVATESLEGATALMLPVDGPGGAPIPDGAEMAAELGDLRAETHYFVAVRAVDRLNRAGPISVAEVTTLAQQFVTVSPCFVATAAFGSPLAAEVDVLRRFRDRFLLTHAPGRALVAAYYRHGPAAADWLRVHPRARSVVRFLLTPIVKGLELLDV